MFYFVNSNFSGNSPKNRYFHLLRLLEHLAEYLLGAVYDDGGSLHGVNFPQNLF